MGRVKELFMEMLENGYENIQAGEKFVCAKHFQDPYLSKYVQEHSAEGICSYCGTAGHVADMADVIPHIGFVIKMYYSNIDEECLPLASTYFDDANEEIPGIKRIGNFAAPAGAEDYFSTSELLHDLVETDNYLLDKDVDSIFYDQPWIKKDAFEPWKHERMTWQWERFSELVKTKCRYTFWSMPDYGDGNGTLADILKDLGSVLCTTGAIEELPIGTSLYRVRGLYELKESYNFNDITSPPDGMGGQCRMSPAGVSMFYAAFDSRTAFSEYLKSKEHVATLLGEFKTKVPLRVVDLTTLPEYVSIWMDNWESVSFLKSFHSSITQPVNEKQENIDYIPSQVFVEYLRWMFVDTEGKSIDGLIYKSSKSDSKNIVLFCNQSKSAEWLTLDNHHVEKL